MKNMVLFLIMLFTAASIYSQEKAKAFLNRLPAMPSDPCAYNKESRERYLKTIDDFNEEVQAELAPLKEQTESNYQSSANDVMKNYMKQFNLSQADIDKMKAAKGNKKDEEKAKAELANKIVQEKYNMNIDVEQYNKLSKEGKEAYAQGLGAEKMAEMQADPQAYKANENKDAETVELMKQRDQIMDKIHTADQSYINKMQEFSKFERKAYEEMDAQRAPLLRAIGQEEGDGVDITKQVKGLEDGYCGAVTPRYLKLVKEKIETLRTMLPDYEKLGKIYARLNQKTTMSNKDLYSPELMSLSVVESIVGMMKTVCDYSIHTFEE